MNSNLHIARKRNWYEYINKNIAQECQLVTAINMYYFLTGKTIRQESDLYNDYCKLCGAVAGTATCIEKIYDVLGIMPDDTHIWLFDAGKFVAKLPLELAIWHKSYGYHSVCIVDYEPITKSVRIPNAKNITNLDGWMYDEDLFHFVKYKNELTHSLDNIDNWKYRTFVLK